MRSFLARHGDVTFHAMIPVTASVFLCVVAAHAQQPPVPASPGVYALVIDPSGAKIANATIRVFAKNTSDGEPLREARTDTSGRVVLTLPPGDYLVQAEAPGFTMLQQSITLADSAPRLELNLKLTIAAAAETVDVALEDTESTSNSESLVLKGNRLATLFR